MPKILAPRLELLRRPTIHLTELDESLPDAMWIEVLNGCSLERLLKKATDGTGVAPVHPLDARHCEQPGRKRIFKIRFGSPLAGKRVNGKFADFEVGRFMAKSIEPLHPSGVSIGRAKRHRAYTGDALEFLNRSRRSVVEQPTIGRPATK